ncbi:MAG TPA: DUF655 domain-containing protein [Methanofastidiosum sp.]|nr:DUF655 domain-containing protein [Methanofastidiosum sp.]HNU62070.1 DUF655 domain-containing protein [Methanofastidiosum sp.]
MMMRTGIFEEYGIVLDYLPQGFPGENLPPHKRTPIAHIIGENYFSLLEVVPSEDLSMYERVFIGKGKRDKIARVKKRLRHNELSATAKGELRFIVEKIVSENEQKFVEFFSTSGPISIRYHKLELLPGLGKKLMNEILEERKKGPFKSFNDIKERVPSIPDPKKMIINRIINEMQEVDRYSIFVSRPPKEME